MCWQLVKGVFWSVTPCSSLDSYCAEEYYCSIFRVEEWAMWENLYRQREKTENNRTLGVSHWDVVVPMRPTTKTSQGKEVKRYVKEKHNAESSLRPPSPLWRQYTIYVNWQLCCRQMALVHYQAERQMKEWSQYTESCEWRHEIKCRWACTVSCKWGKKEEGKAVSQCIGLAEEPLR